MVKMSGPINLVERIDALHKLIDFKDICDWLIDNPEVVGFELVGLQIPHVEFRPKDKALWVIMQWKNQTTNALKMPTNRAEKLSKLGFKTNRINNYKERADTRAIMRSDDWPSLAVAYAMLTAEENA
jgi:hypothetical protein